MRRVRGELTEIVMVEVIQFNAFLKKDEALAFFSKIGLGKTVKEGCNA